MQTINSPQALRNQVNQWRTEKAKVAFVPTMGNLHDGHLQLVREAKKQADKVIVSIFVNPMQFGPNEDFDSYPRTMDEDSKKLAELATDCLFAPTVKEMYPHGLETQTTVANPTLGEILCGASRPAFFPGICTVVAKLFNMVQPDMAFFGEKDFQQLTIIKKMVKDLCFPIEIVGVPTVREEDGLAMSSRNNYLSTGNRQSATFVYRLLKQAEEKIRSGEADFQNIEKNSLEELSKSGFKPDYFSIRNKTNLDPAKAADKNLIIFAAADLDGTRLIDNIYFQV